MKQKPRSRRKRSCTKSVLRMPDLEPAKAGVLNSLTCPDAQKGISPRHRLCSAVPRFGGELEQIQFLLGYVSVHTTERYLGCKQRIRSAVNDRIGIEPMP